MAGPFALQGGSVAWATAAVETAAQVLTSPYKAGMDSCRGEFVDGFLLAARLASDESVIPISENPTPVVPLSMPVVEPLQTSNLNARSEVSRTTIGEKAVTRTFVRDGGGVVSSADWQQARCTLPAFNDPFSTLRRELLSSVLTKDVVGRFKA